MEPNSVFLKMKPIDIFLVFWMFFSFKKGKGYDYASLRNTPVTIVSDLIHY